MLWIDEYTRTIAYLKSNKPPSQQWQDSFSRLANAAIQVQQIKKEFGPEGNLVDVIQLAKHRSDIEKPANIKRLYDIGGYSFFTFGPVYSHCSVDRDIIEAFHELTVRDKTFGAFDPHRLAFNFKTPILTGCGNEWDYYVEAIPTENMAALKMLALSQRFRVYNTNAKIRPAYWGIHSVDRVIPDPVAAHEPYYNEERDRCAVTVFLPTGNLYKMTVDALSSLPIGLIKVAPDNNLANEADRILNNQETRWEHQSATA